MEPTYTMRCGTSVSIVPMSAHEIAAELPEDHARLYGLEWTLDADGSRSFAAYVDGSIAAYSVNRDEGRVLHHGLVERIGGPQGVGRVVFAHDGLVLSSEPDRDAWIVDAAHPRMDSLLRTLGYAPSGMTTPGTYRFAIDVSAAKKRKTLRKRMKSVLSAFIRSYSR